MRVFTAVHDSGAQSDPTRGKTALPPESPRAGTGLTWSNPRGRIVKALLIPGLGLRRRGSGEFRPSARSRVSVLGDGARKFRDLPSRVFSRRSLA